MILLEYIMISGPVESRYVSLLRTFSLLVLYGREWAQHISKISRLKSLEIDLLRAGRVHVKRHWGVHWTYNGCYREAHAGGTELTYSRTERPLAPVAAARRLLALEESILALIRWCRLRAAKAKRGRTKRA